MTRDELVVYVDAAGGKRPFAHRLNISERYVDMLMKGERTMSQPLAALARLKIKLPGR